MKRIIVVDDDPAILETFDLVLRTTYTLSLYSGAGPLLNGAFEPPDLFIIDNQLSGASGTSLCEYLKKQDGMRSIPVILVSASPDIPRIAQRAGADAALEKPFSIKELRSLVERMVG